MDLRHLAYLAALAREQHFGRAARACHVSQPTLSSGIRRLESEVGFPVVRRTQRYEGLTPEGERVLEWARRILADVGGLEAEVDAMRGGLSGQLRIGAIPTSLPSRLAPDDAALRTDIPASRSPSTRSTRGRSSAASHEFELELGSRTSTPSRSRGVRTLPLYREHYVLLTDGDGPLGRRRRGELGGGGDAAALPPDRGHAEPPHRRRHLPRGGRRTAAVGRDELDLDADRPRPGRPVVERDGPCLAARLDVRRAE